MADRIQEIIRTEDIMKNAFRNRERAVILAAAMSSQTNAVKVWEMLPQLADEQLRAGNPRSALASYEKFEQTALALGQTISAKSRQMIQHEKAISFLRIGEQTKNCLTNHTIESCLFPIRKLGVLQASGGAA